MSEMSKNYKILLIAILVAGISCIHYLSRLSYVYEHIFFRDLYFFPIVLAGFWFGLKGALWTSLSITAIYLPYIIITWGKFSPADFDNVLQLLLYNAVAVVLGILKDREEAQHRSFMKSESLAAVGRAVSGVAHDMRTPLMAIGGFTLQVKRKLKKGDPDREKLEIVLLETRRLEAMVKEMLDFSKPLELKRVEGSPNQLIRRSIAMVMETAESKNVRIDLNLSEGLPPALFDAMRMEQVLINLLVNAVQASSEGQVVSVLSFQEYGYVRIDVQDRGSGITPEDQEKIFTPFFTTKKDGNGLGLPIVKKIVEAHGGEISFESNGKSGSTFTVRIPVVLSS